MGSYCPCHSIADDACKAFLCRQRCSTALSTSRMCQGCSQWEGRCMCGRRLARIRVGEMVCQYVCLIWRPSSCRMCPPPPPWRPPTLQRALRALLHVPILGEAEPRWRAYYGTGLFASAGEGGKLASWLLKRGSWRHVTSRRGWFRDQAQELEDSSESLMQRAESAEEERKALMAEVGVMQQPLDPWRHGFVSESCLTRHEEVHDLAQASARRSSRTAGSSAPALCEAAGAWCCVTLRR